MLKSPERPNEVRRVSKELGLGTVCWNTTVEKLVFSKSRHDTHLLPIFPSIDNKRIKCFHATGPWNFQSLIGLQRSKKAISAATKISSNFIEYGVSGSGIVAVVSGNFLLGGFSDLGTIPDQNGQRWIPAKNLGWLGLKEKVEEIQQEVLRKNGILDTIFKEVPEKVNQDLKRKITSDYIECTRTLWKEVKEHARKEEEESKKLEYDEQINEVVVDSIVIKFVLITNDKECVVKPMCEKNGIRYLYLNRKKALRWLETFIEKNRAS